MPVTASLGIHEIVVAAPSIRIARPVPPGVVDAVGRRSSRPRSCRRQGRRCRILARPHTAHRDGVADRDADAAVQRHRGLDRAAAPARPATGARRCLRSGRSCARRSPRTAAPRWAPRATASSSSSTRRGRRSLRRSRRSAGCSEHSWPDGVDVRVRMGLHTGEPQPHEDGYIGEDVHRAARIGSTANGGQIVLSASTERLLGATARSAASRSGSAPAQGPGRRRAPVRRRGPGLPRDFPPLRSPGRARPARLADPARRPRAASGATLAELLGRPATRLVDAHRPGRVGQDPARHSGGRRRSRPTIPTASTSSGCTPPGRRGDVVDDRRRARPRRRAPAATSPRSRRPGCATARALLRAGQSRADPGRRRRRRRVAVGRAASTCWRRRGGRCCWWASASSLSPPLALPSAAERRRAAPRRPRCRCSRAGPTGASVLRRDRRQRTRPSPACAGASTGCRWPWSWPPRNCALLSPPRCCARLDGRLGTAFAAADRPDRQRTLGATIAWSYDLLADPTRRSCAGSGCSAPAPTSTRSGRGRRPDGRSTILDVVAGWSPPAWCGWRRAPTANRASLLETIRTFARDRWPSR